MPEVVCNTSPLQYLHQCGQLSLLESLAGRVLIPEAVRDEVLDGVAHGIDLPNVANVPWLEIRKVAPLPSDMLPPHLGAGETEVLVLGLQLNHPILILDDAHARRAAQMLGLSIRGTLGVLLDAKKAGLVAAVRPIIDDLQAHGFRLSDSTREEVLKLAGEMAP